MPDKQVGSRSVATSSSGPDSRNGSRQQPAWSISSLHTSATMTAPRRALKPWRRVATVLPKVACGPGIPCSCSHITAPCSAAWVPAVVVSPTAFTHAPALLCCVPAGSIAWSIAQHGHSPQQPFERPLLGNTQGDTAFVSIKDTLCSDEKHYKCGSMCQTQRQKVRESQNETSSK